MYTFPFCAAWDDGIQIVFSAKCYIYIYICACVCVCPYEKTLEENIDFFPRRFYIYTFIDPIVKTPSTVANKKTPGHNRK